MIIFSSFANSSSASEVTGNISTGLTGNVNSTLTGTVITPPVIVPITNNNPSNRGGGGGGGRTSLPPAPGKILGAQTTSWTNLSASEKATIIKLLQTQLLEIIKMLNEMIADGSIK